MVAKKKPRLPGDPPKPKNYEVVPGPAEEAEGTVHPADEKNENKE
jgi:hypothetical protein